MADDDVPPPPPPPPIPHQNYGEASYWDDRYAREPICFDWYQGWAGLQEVILRHFKPDEPLLHVGMGTSRLQEGMVEHGGFKRVVNVDVSSVVVDLMNKHHEGIPELEYVTGDIRSLPQYPDGAFGGALDKGTLDAILCGGSPTDNAAAALDECHRLVRPGGCFMLVTYGEPESRLLHLVRPELRWRVQVYVLTKPTPAEASAPGGPQQRAVLQGPFDVADKPCMDALAAVKDVHFVYACTKLEPDAAAEGEGAAEAGGGAGGGAGGSGSDGSTGSQGGGGEDEEAGGAGNAAPQLSGMRIS